MNRVIKAVGCTVYKLVIQKLLFFSFVILALIFAPFVSLVCVLDEMNYKRTSWIIMWTTTALSWLLILGPRIPGVYWHPNASSEFSFATNLDSFIFLLFSTQVFCVSFAQIISVSASALKNTYMSCLQDIEAHDYP